MAASVNQKIAITETLKKIASAGQTIEEMEMPDNTEMFVHFMAAGVVATEADQKDDDAYCYKSGEDRRHILRVLTNDMWVRTRRPFELKIMVY